ncbi:MAG: hypothetical protein KME11_03080 [Timaviella obliquedivisa GSE-PSE-MK23-08B]|jgi:hypothetical protein|nr:hypothetical protein [Timaviella obliquedivisa GSE-PSE-MK23-08B]MBW4514191.1 hypothetical protein [Timaviella obliquedivisa GSE-PSE-MK23-08B]
MTWNQIAEFTLTQNWQYTAPLAGRLFRFRHLTSDPESRGLVSQGFLNETFELLDTRRINPKNQHDLIDFVCPDELIGYRRLALKLNTFSTTSWTVAIDVFEAVDPTNEPTLLSLAIDDHEADLTAHSQYVDSTELLVALADRVKTSDLTAALADKVTTAALMTALAANANRITLTAQTTDATLTEIVTPQRVLIHANSSAGYEISLVGHSTAATPEFIYWLGSGALYRGAAAASTVLQTATGTRRSSLGNGTNWTPTVTADTVNGGLKIQVKGDAGKTIKWVASVQLTEVW